MVKAAVDRDYTCFCSIKVNQDSVVCSFHQFVSSSGEKLINQRNISVTKTVTGVTLFQGIS